MQKSQVSPLLSTKAIALGSLDIKLLVVDIDGTICGESNQVSAVVKQAISQAQDLGIQVAIATGRMYSSACRFHAEIGSQLPILAYQGAWIQDPKTQAIHRHVPLAAPIAADLIDYWERPSWQSIISIHLYVGDRLYVREVKPDTVAYQVRSSIEPIVVPDLRQVLQTEGGKEVNPTKVLAMAAKAESIAQLHQEILSDRHSDGILRFSPSKVHLTRSVPTYLEATHPQSHKGDAVRFLAEELLGWKRHNVMAIGDNFNDVEMLTYAGLGIAMGNAPLEVQAVAQWVAPPVEADGVAAAIAKFIIDKSL